MPTTDISFYATGFKIVSPTEGFSSLNLSPTDFITIENTEKNNGIFSIKTASDTEIVVNEPLNTELNTSASIKKATSAEPKPVKPIEPETKPKSPEVITPIVPPVPPPYTPPAEVIISRIEYPKWWNDEGVAKISLTSPGSQFVITARADYSLYIATIVFTVSGDCDIVLSFGQSGSSGSMNFGGEDEPRGIVIATGNSPTPCGSGSFMITSSSDETVTIGGFVSYYLWKKPTTP